MSADSDRVKAGARRACEAYAARQDELKRKAAERAATPRQPRKPSTGKLEKSVRAAAEEAGAELGVRLYPNPSGVFQTRDGRWVRAGLAPGSPDLVGWLPVTITAEMVGRTVAVFTGLETKRERGGTVSDGQERFLARLERDGAITGVVRAGADVARLVAMWRNRR